MQQTDDKPTLIPTRNIFGVPFGQPMGIHLTRFDLLQLAEARLIQAQTEPDEVKAAGLVREAQQLPDAYQDTTRKLRAVLYGG